MGTTKRRPPKPAPDPGADRNGAAAHSAAAEYQRQQEEQELDRRIFQYVGKGPADYDADLWVTIRESLRLQLLYPNKHVVFRDRWEGRGDTLRLLEVQPLLITDDSVEASNFVTQLVNATPLHEQPYLGFTFTEPLLMKPRGRKAGKGKRGK